MNNDFKAIFRRLIYIFIFFIFSLSVVLFYIIKRQNNILNFINNSSSVNIKKDKNQNIEENGIKSPVKISNWLDVQNKVKDTVVQIFVQANIFNWLEPYKSPEQYESFGSGFFINDKGYILTNFHVVNQASSVQIQIPSFGRERFNIEIIGVCPDKDLALLKLTNESLDQIKKRLGKIPFLSLGNSDIVVRSQEVLALGYPLAQERLKSTLGIVSGRERSGFIQITAPLNPGNSGGPALNFAGEVIGINFAGILEAQNVGYIIPINEVKNSVKDLYKVKLLRKPFLGCLFSIATSGLAKYLSNPDSGGWYIMQVFEGTILNKIGVKEDDMLYEINGYKLDLYGELSVPWSEDKISFIDFLNRFKVGDQIDLVIYRKGQRKEFKFKLNDDYLPPVRKVYPEYEPNMIDYEIIGGMVVMSLSLNHIIMLLEKAPELAKYIKPEAQHEPALIITHILPDSQAKNTRILSSGSIIDQVNGINVSTLEQFRKAVEKCKKGGYLTIKTKDKTFVAISVDEMLKDEDMLSSRYYYKKSKLIEILENRLN